jgi:hypothetical protein
VFAVDVLACLPCGGRLRLNKGRIADRGTHSAMISQA